MKTTNIFAAVVSALTIGMAATGAHADEPTTGIPIGVSFGGNLKTTAKVTQIADQGHHGTQSPLRADGHAPIGVMGDHMHKAGEWMFSYRFMTMRMEDNLNGTDELSPETIATTIPNRFGTPTNLRVVPLDMSMDMHMVGMMYAPTDWLTLMGMGGYTSKSMAHRTFAGATGTTVRGEFDVDTSGFNDTRISGLVKLYRNDTHKLHANIGVSLPTGSYKETAEILTPAGGTPTLRAPYAMQIGSGTFDLLPGITYAGHSDRISWGAQFAGFIPLGKNGGGYSLGQEVSLSAWGSYQWEPWISTSLRLTGTSRNQIDGIDSAIAVPNQTADPDNYGGDRIDLSLGLNLMGQMGAIRGHRLAAEVTVPLHQDLNGPQLGNSWMMTLGYQKAF